MDAIGIHRFAQMFCYFVMLGRLVVGWVTLQSPLQESEGRVGIAPSYDAGQVGISIFSLSGREVKRVRLSRQPAL